MNGNLIVTGNAYYSSTSPGSRAVVTIKYSPERTQLWAARYNGQIANGHFPYSALAVDSEGAAYVGRRGTIHYFKIRGGRQPALGGFGIERVWTGSDGRQHW
jgi:hypothetical protein